MNKLDEIRALDMADRYLDAIARCAARRDAAAAKAIPLPRAEHVFGMANHHADNCRKAGLAVPPGQGAADSSRLAGDPK